MFAQHPGQAPHVVTTHKSTTVVIPRGLYRLLIAAAIAGVATLALGFLVALGVAVGHPSGQQTVSYTAPANQADPQHGPTRQPNQAEMNAYGVALETSYGTCGLEWHGATQAQAGWWEPVCQGPNSGK